MAADAISGQGSTASDNLENLTTDTKSPAATLTTSIEGGSPQNSDTKVSTSENDETHEEIPHPDKQIDQVQDQMTELDHVTPVAASGSADPQSVLPRRPLSRNKPAKEDKSDWVDKPNRKETADPIITSFMDDTAEWLSTTELFEVYLKRLQKLNKAGSGTKDKEKIPVLVRSFIDYLSSYDERMKKLEDKVGIISKDDVAKESDSPDIEGVKFYDVDAFGDATAGASNDEEDEWNVKGAFCSAIEADHRIRVLFKWNTSEHGTEENGSHPAPSLIDILEIRIKSKPIALFFEKELDYNISQNGLIHFAKPFRFLIRKIDLLQDHVDSSRGKQSSSNLPMNPSVRSVKEDEGVEHGPENSPKTLARGTSTVDPSSPEFLESEEALVHFEELLKFSGSYLATDIERFRAYSKGKRSHIAFDNLWMLFDSKETVYCQLKKGDNKIYDEKDEDHAYMGTRHVETPQVYRVLATLGGIARNPTTPVDSQFRKGQRKSPLPLISNAQEHIRGKRTSLFVDCYCIQFDGVRFRPVADSFEFKPFQGDLPVTDLEVYPLRYLTDENEKALESLVERGATYVGLTSVKHVSHKGLTVGERKEEINSPVIVDFKSAYQYDGRWKPELKQTHAITWLWDQKSILEIPKRTCSHKNCHKTACLEDVAIAQQKGCLEKGFRDISIVLDDYIVDSRHQIERITEDLRSQGLLQLLPGTAFAFALRNRKWVQVDLSNLGTVKQEDNWDDLILPRGHKAMVQAMVETHTASSALVEDTRGRNDYEVDLVPGKGKGCIILLHGEPGVGKTSTAECVAAYTKRPLYPITCGDIGITPAEVELALDIHFNRAHKWGCVLLLDEADIFLAKRNKSGDDIKRNGLVSVFLRTLEYYSGILFLTTNRVGSFDDAFRSRIHVQLHYPKLSKKRAVKIWETNISRLERHNERRRGKNVPEIVMDKKKILKFAKANFEKHQWNGRQIRNAFQTAVSLAEFEVRKQDGRVGGPEVTRKHFEQVAAATAEFDEYLKEVHQGMDEDKIAHRDQDRVSYTPKAKSKVEPDDSSSSDSESSDSSNGSDSDSEDSDSPALAKSKRSKKKKKEKEKERRRMRSLKRHRLEEGNGIMA